MVRAGGGGRNRAFGEQILSKRIEERWRLVAFGALVGIGCAEDGLTGIGIAKLK